MPCRGREPVLPPVITRRTVIFGLGCLRQLSPSTFPWAVDRTAHLARRKILSGPVPGEGAAIELTQLHIALDAYMRSPTAEHMTRARQELARVQDYTAGATRFRWREVHYFAMILLNAADWHPLRG
jgi:hypothetical protein